jgi:hypothetical protein
LHANELTAQVIDETLNSSLGESTDQPSVSSDHFRGTTSHAFLDPVDHLPIPPRQDRGSSMPRDLFVHNNLSTVFVFLDDRITPTQLRFNMSQAAFEFRFYWITRFASLI